MLNLQNVFSKKATTYALAGLTLLAGAQTAVSVSKDLEQGKNKIELTSDTDSASKQNVLPISNESVAYATMFSLGLLGTGVVASEKRKANNYNKFLNEIASNQNFQVKFDDDNSFQLVDRNKYPIDFSTFKLEGYSQNEILEFIYLAVSDGFKPKYVKGKDLIKPEVKKFQENIKNTVKYSRNNIEQNLIKNHNINKYDAMTDSLELNTIMRGLPVEVKEEYMNIYLEKGRTEFCYDRIPVIDGELLQEELLKRHGINIEIIESNDALTGIQEENSASNDVEIQEGSVSINKIVVTDLNGSKKIYEDFYCSEFLNKLTKELAENNWEYNS